MTDIIFEEPPASRRRGANVSYQDATATLKSRPGEWAIVRIAPTGNSADSTAHQIRVGILKSFRPAGHFDAVSRVIDGTFRVYARYVGTGGDPE